MKIKLSKYEKEILNAYEKGELKTVKDFANKKKLHASYAKKFLEFIATQKIVSARMRKKGIKPKDVEKAIENLRHATSRTIK
ncbi:MAG TPA: hypothetical protein VK791_01435 [bacterium]|nr:hypothetical protein [bacterium]